jgi:hypothetical protein
MFFGGAAHPVTPSLCVAEQVWLGFEEAHCGVSKKAYMTLVIPAFRALLMTLSSGVHVKVPLEGSRFTQYDPPVALPDVPNGTGTGHDEPLLCGPTVMPKKVFETALGAATIGFGTAGTRSRSSRPMVTMTLGLIRDLSLVAGGLYLNLRGHSGREKKEPR